MEKIGTEKLYKVEEVGVIIGSSYKTIQNWYMFKKENPENELAKLLPDFIQKAPRQTRYWKESDIPKLLEFKSKIPQGRNGIMGSVTQKYYKKGKKEQCQEETI